MTQNQVYDAYLAWLGNSVPKPLSDLFQCPLINFDIFEDSNSLINWLFYLVPSFSNGSLRCFIFFEENEFQKDLKGDLHLIHSSLHLMESYN